MKRIIGCIALLGSMIQADYDKPYYLYAQVGGSFSRCADIFVNTDIWDPAETSSSTGLGRLRTRSITSNDPELLNLMTETSTTTRSQDCAQTFPNSDPQGCPGPATGGYDATLCTAPVVGFGFGYYFTDWLSASVSCNHRSKFKYRKFQIPTAAAVSTPGFAGDKTRCFDFDNTSFMINLRFDHEFCPSYSCLPYVKPYGLVGIGMAKNTLYNFHSVTTTPVPAITAFPSFAVASIMTYNVTNQFAWQTEFGIDASYCDNIFVGIGYRYFSGHKFYSNNYLIDKPSGLPSPLTILPWCGRFATQELLLSFSMEF